ncbi:uncharacterized protein Tco025E_06846 [Trypanosoma conorhini]|uniref:Uncharacterized protein n=1 Tax=Trypanosoma conorhini TaxID=83891 RepID=A0A3R7KUM1_9TRYP|nr:uncharacterized protein Tco025E_06846 [Trypanosoma conorhini]RNF10059.1 hypothetical protein Tco025E_06846 [Trypanosoma conorhini]
MAFLRDKRGLSSAASDPFLLHMCSLCKAFYFFLVLFVCFFDTLFLYSGACESRCGAVRPHRGELNTGVGAEERGKEAAEPWAMLEEADDGVRELEDELRHQLELLAEERKVLGELQRQMNCAATGSADGDGPSRRDRLVASNRALRRALEKLRREDRRPINDPQVNEVRNKITAAWKEVGEVEAEVKTLLSVRRQRNKGLEEVREGDRSVSALRGRQQEEERNLRAKLKELESELKAVEKKDFALHERFTQLQKQALLHVTEKDAAALRAKYEQQMKLIDELQRQRGELALARGEAAGDGRRLTLKAEKAKAEMEREIAELQELVLARDEELTQLYRSLGK